MQLAGLVQWKHQLQMNGVWCWRMSWKLSVFDAFVTYVCRQLWLKCVLVAPAWVNTVTESCSVMLSQNASGFHLTYNEIYWSQMTGTDSLELIERFRWSTSHVAMPSIGPATVCITFILSALSCIPVDVKTHNWHAAVFGFVNQHFLPILAFPG